MTYLLGGAEYLEEREIRVMDAVAWLADNGHTANNSQVAARSGLSRSAVSDVTAHLRRRGYLTDVARRSSAYHWRVTDKPRGQRACPRNPEPHTLDECLRAEGGDVT